MEKTIIRLSKISFSCFWFISCCLICILFLSINANSQTNIVWSENWESGIGRWFATNGVWEAGIPTTNPPANAHTGQNCAATVLRGYYPANANTSLVSPEIVLPTLPANEELQLRFWHWFNQYPEDPGIVQISVDNGISWTTISNQFIWNSDKWTQYIIDISGYANSTIRLAFYFTSNGNNQANGWYIDDISIVKGVFTLNNPESFELGIGDWYADNGVWEVGVPTTNPPINAHSGQNCAATVLRGFYPADSRTRLISPEFTLPTISEGEELQLRFWHWFNQYPEDPGVIQISADNGITWTTISKKFDWNSDAWTQYIIDISAYADSTVRFAFYFTSNGSNQANGWYIDDISIVKGVFVLSNPENFELGIDAWFADKGVWEVGVPTAGPDTAHSHPNCAGTVLGGFYPANANTRLISPAIRLIPKAGQKPELFFWHWFNIFPEDSAYVQISVERGPWQKISRSFNSNSGWTQFWIDLSPYINFTVRFAYYFASNGSNQANGWYIDDIRIEGIISTEIESIEDEMSIPTEFNLYQNYPNPFNPSTTIEFSIPYSTHVVLKIYDLLGREVATLVDEELPMGQHKVNWNAQNLASGVYIYKIQTAEFGQTKKMILMH